MENDINTLKLIATASAHLKVHGIQSGIVPMPGTDKSIVIGSPAEVVELMPELRGAIPAAWHNFARAIANLPHGAEANIAGMQSKAAQLLAAEGARGKVLPKDEGAVGGTSEQQARYAIDGAIQYGRENRNPPPSTGHWLYEYWNIGQQLRELGKTGWDNVTPAASQPVAASAGIEGLTRYEPSEEGMFRNNVSGAYVEYREVKSLLATQSAKQGTQQAEVNYKIIQRTIIGLRDGWATRADADTALMALCSGYAIPVTQASVEQAPVAQEVTQQAAKAETADRVAIRAWLDAEKASREAIEAYNEAVRESDKYIWPGTDINSEFQIMSQAKNKAFHAMHAMYDALVAPTTSTVSASGALAAADDVRDEALEEAALAVEDEVPCTCCFSDDEVALAASLAETIRAKKSKSAASTEGECIDRAAQAATDKSEDSAMTRDEWIAAAAAKLKPYLDEGAKEYAETLYKDYVEGFGEEWAVDPEGAVAEDMSYWDTDE